MENNNLKNNQLNQNIHIMYGRDFFIRLNLRNKDGVILYDSTRYARVALSKELIEMLAHILTFNAFNDGEEIHNFFNSYILNWNNNDYHSNDPTIVAEIFEFHNDFVHGLLFSRNAREQLQSFLLNQPSQVIGAYFVLDRARIYDGFQLEAWYDQINLDDC